MEISRSFLCFKAFNKELAAANRVSVQVPLEFLPANGKVPAQLLFLHTPKEPSSILPLNDTAAMENIARRIATVNKLVRQYNCEATDEYATFALAYFFSQVAHPGADTAVEKVKRTDNRPELIHACLCFLLFCVCFAGLLQFLGGNKTLLALWRGACGDAVTAASKWISKPKVLDSSGKESTLARERRRLAQEIYVHAHKYAVPCFCFPSLR